MTTLSRPPVFKIGLHTQRSAGLEAAQLPADPVLEPAIVYRGQAALPRGIAVRMVLATPTLPDLEERPIDTSEVFEVGPSAPVVHHDDVIEPPSRFMPIDLLTPGGVVQDKPQVSQPVLSTRRSQGRAQVSAYADQPTASDTVLVATGLAIVASMVTLLVMLFTGYGAA
jgi:hypothetical protein